MREQRQVVARLDVERGVHPEKVRDAVLITVRTGLHRKFFISALNQLLTLKKSM